MKVLKGYNSAASAKRRLLVVVGRDEVLTIARGGENEKTSKVMASSNAGGGWNGINGLLCKVRVTNRTR